MKNYRPVLIILLIAVILILFKFIFFPNEKSSEKATKKNGSAVITNVNGYVATEQKINNVIYTNGSLHANEKTTIQSEISGILTSIQFKDGQKVIKGQVLATVNDAEWRAQLKKAEAQQKLSKQRKDRYEKLLEAGGISREEYESAEAELSAYNADIELLESQIAKAKIRAPFNGVLGFRKISPGSFVSPGAVLVDIVQNSPLKVEFSVPEKYAANFSLNSKVYFTVEGTDSTYEADLYSSEPEVNIETRTISYHAIYPNKNQELKPGSFVRVTIYPDKDLNGILVPTQSVIPVLQGKKVFIVEDGKARERVVTTGLRTEKMIHITSGIEAGDTVITTGIMSLSDGKSLKIIKEATDK